jgi:MFS family permease
VLLVVWAFPFFLLIDTTETAPILFGVVVLASGLGLSYGPQAAFFAELFEPQYRYSGVSFAYAVGAVFGGGFAPLIATALQTSTRASWPVSAWSALLLCCYSLRREPPDRGHSARSAGGWGQTDDIDRAVDDQVRRSAVPGGGKHLCGELAVG